MSNQEIYNYFRTQTQWVKFSDFLENCIEWIDTEIITTELRSNGGVDEQEKDNL